MPWPNALDFMSAQRTPSGNLLAKPFMAQVIAVIAAGQRLNITVLPPVDQYASYGLHAILDPSIPPFTLRLDVEQYGAQPFFAIAVQGATDHPIDVFAKVTTSQPSNYQVTNLTAVAQRFVVTFQGLHVTTQEDDIELQQRLATYYNLANEAARLESERPRGDRRPA